MHLAALPVRLVLLTCMLATFAASAAYANRIDDAVERVMARRGVPGVSIAVIDEGRIVRAEGYGVLQQGRAECVDPTTLFQAASISKPVAALGALRLIEQGKLELDADVNTYLSSWKVPESEHTSEQRVTIRRILSHSAGLSVHGFGGYSIDQPLPSVAQILDGAPPANSGPVRVEQTPGTQWRYSGGGYTILQQATSDVSGQAFEDFLKEVVLDPFGMRSSSFEQPLRKDRVEAAATGHYWNGTDLVPLSGRFHVYPEQAAAGLWATPSDLARFAIGIQNSLAGRANPVISPELTREMLTPQMRQSSLGFVVRGTGSTQRFEHGGRNAGFDSLLTAYLEKGKGAVVMMNANVRSDRSFREILDAIAIEYDWPEYPRLGRFEPVFAFYEDFQNQVHLSVLVLVIAALVALWLVVKRFRRRNMRKK